MNTFADSLRREAPWEALVRRIEGTAALDAVGKPIGKAIRGAVSPGAVKDALAGTWLGHAVHPMLTDVVIGSFTSATLLDLFGGPSAATASERLIGVGIAAYLPTAVTGLSDWADTEIADEKVRRDGLAHASVNALALTLYTASLGARRRGRRGRGTVLGVAGAAALMAGGYLGGHMSLRRGVGPNQTVFDPGSTEWTPASGGAEFPEGKLTRVLVDETPVVVVKEAGRYFALHDRCSHRGCSLSEGELEGEEIICACHGSRFDRRDGSIRQGPATSPQPAFEVRERDGALELRRVPE